MSAYDDLPLLDRPAQDQQQCWAGRLAMAVRYRDQYGNTDNRWNKNVRALAADFNSPEELGAESIDVNVSAATVQTKLPPFWVIQPHIVVRPRAAPELIDAAERVQLELNYWLDELELRKQVRLALLDCEATNHGYILVGRTPAGQQPAVRHPLVRAGQPFALRVSPMRVLHPPGYCAMEEMPWVAIQWRKPLRDARKRWPEYADSIKPSDRLDAGDTSDRALQNWLQTDDAATAVITQIFDLELERIWFICSSCDVPLEVKSWKAADGYPLAHISPNEIPDEFYATPPMNYYYQQNKELNANRTAMRKRRNRTKSIKWVAGEISDDAISAYKNAEDNEIIKVDTAGADIRTMVLEDQGPPLDPSDLAYDSILKQDIMLMSGIGSEQRGAGDPNIHSATASANVEKHAQIRGSGLGDHVRGFWLKVASMLWREIQATAKNDEVTRFIVGPRLSQLKPVRYNVKELAGEYRFEMELAALTPDSQDQRQVRSMANYNMFRQDPLVNPEALLVDVLRAQNVQDPERYLSFLRDPGQELQLMLQGLPVEPHERDDHAAHMQQHDLQSEQIDQAIQGGQGGEKARLTQMLLLAHVNATVALISKQQEGQTAGKPVAENLMRKQFQVAARGETEAELRGQPIGEA